MPAPTSRTPGSAGNLPFQDIQTASARNLANLGRSLSQSADILKQKQSSDDKLWAMEVESKYQLWQNEKRAEYRGNPQVNQQEIAMKEEDAFWSQFKAEELSQDQSNFIKEMRFKHNPRFFGDAAGIGIQTRAQNTVNSIDRITSAQADIFATTNISELSAEQVEEIVNSGLETIDAAAGSTAAGVQYAEQTKDTYLNSIVRNNAFLRHHPEKAREIALQINDIAKQDNAINAINSRVSAISKNIVQASVDNFESLNNAELADSLFATKADTVQTEKLLEGLKQTFPEVADVIADNPSLSNVPSVFYAEVMGNAFDIFNSEEFENLSENDKVAYRKSILGKVKKTLTDVSDIFQDPKRYQEWLQANSTSVKQLRAALSQEELAVMQILSSDAPEVLKIEKVQELSKMTENYKKSVENSMKLHFGDNVSATFTDVRSTNQLLNTINNPNASALDKYRAGVNHLIINQDRALPNLISLRNSKQIKTPEFSSMYSLNNNITPEQHAIINRGASSSITQASQQGAYAKNRLQPLLSEFSPDQVDGVISDLQEKFNEAWGDNLTIYDTSKVSSIDENFLSFGSIRKTQAWAALIEQLADDIRTAPEGQVVDTGINLFGRLESRAEQAINTVVGAYKGNNLYIKLNSPSGENTSTIKLTASEFEKVGWAQDQWNKLKPMFGFGDEAVQLEQIQDEADLQGTLNSLFENDLQGADNLFRLAMFSVENSVAGVDNRSYTEEEQAIINSASDAGKLTLSLGSNAFLSEEAKQQIDAVLSANDKPMMLDQFDSFEIASLSSVTMNEIDNDTVMMAFNSDAFATQFQGEQNFSNQLVVTYGVKQSDGTIKETNIPVKIKKRDLIDFSKEALRRQRIDANRDLEIPISP